MWHIKRTTFRVTKKNIYSNNQYSTTLNVSTKHAFSHLKCNKPGSFSKVLIVYSDSKENSRTWQTEAGSCTAGRQPTSLQSAGCKARGKEFYHDDLRDEKMQQQMLYLFQVYSQVTLPNPNKLFLFLKPASSLTSVTAVLIPQFPGG